MKKPAPSPVTSPTTPSVITLTLGVCIQLAACAASAPPYVSPYKKTHLANPHYCLTSVNILTNALAAADYHEAGEDYELALDAIGTAEKALSRQRDTCPGTRFDNAQFWEIHQAATERVADLKFGINQILREKEMY